MYVITCTPIRPYEGYPIHITFILYSQTSEQRTLWDLYKLKCFVLCILLGGSKCIRTIGKPIIWDLEKRPLLRGLLYCVPISEVLLYIP